MGRPIAAVRAVSFAAGTWRAVFICFKNKTLSLNPYPLISMTRSMVLKFFFAPEASGQVSGRIYSGLKLIAPGA